MLVIDYGYAGGKQRDTLQAVKAHRPTTGEWFATAKNYVLYANEAGLYDEPDTLARLGQENRR